MTPSVVAACRRAAAAAARRRPVLMGARSLGPGAADVDVVNPLLITHTIWRDDLDRHFRRLPLSGVAAGAWDLERTPFRSTPFFLGLQERFVGQMPWEDTQFWAQLDRPSAARRIAEHGSRAAYLDHVEQLHRSLSTTGFAEAAEPLKVLIGRDGCYIRYHGSHRLALAQILGLDRLRVRVVLRHAEWQSHRNRAAQEDPADRASWADHPDLRLRREPLG